MLSPDGHTRPFDAGAQGTVFSDGAAFVVLKRLSDAQRDRRAELRCHPMAGDFELHRALDIVGSTGVRVMVTTVPYSRGGEKPDGRLYPEDQPDRVSQWNTMLRNIVAQHRGVQILDLNKKLCPDGVYTAKVDGIKVRSDGVHLTPEGVRWLTPWLEESLR